MVSLPCSRCGYGLASGEAYGAVHCGKCGLFKEGEPILATSTIGVCSGGNNTVFYNWPNTTTMTTFICKDCGLCVFTNTLPADRRCHTCIAKAAPPVGTPVVAPKESGAVSPKPHRCPVCDGKGEKPAAFYSRDLTAAGWVPCKACKGAGLVWSP